MARIRTIKPEFWTSEQVMEVSPIARLLFIGMWNFCDDKGVIPASFKTLKAQIFPSDDILSKDIEPLIGELLAQELLGQFEADGRTWWFVTGWHHQLINRPSKSRYPSPPCQIAPLPEAAGQDDSVNDVAETHQVSPQANSKKDIKSLKDHGELTEHSLSTHGELIDGREGKGKEGTTTSLRSVVEREARTPDPAALTSCPACFTATVAHRGLASNLQLDLANEIGMFLANARSKGRMSADWNAEFEMWLRRSRNFGNGKDQQSSAAGKNAGNSRDDGRRAAANTLGVGSQYLTPEEFDHEQLTR